MHKKLYLSSIYFGNLFEHYDTALYSFLAPFFATLFFPGKDDLTALILAFGIAPLGMIARPVGSLVFGYIGDVQGRSRALFLSLSGMAVVTALIGLLPTTILTARIAPVLLLLSRILQNFFAAGENIGGAVCFLERLETENEKDFASSIYNTSTVMGILLASALVTALYHFQCVETGWRWLYIGGSITAFFGVAARYFTPIHHPRGNAAYQGLTRFSCAISSECGRDDGTDCPDSPTAFEKRGFSDFVYRLKSIWDMRATVFTIAMASGFSYATYGVAFSLMNGLVPLVSSISNAEISTINTALLLFDILLLPIFGSLASRFSRTKMMLFAALTAILTGVPLFYLLEGCTVLTVILVRSAFVLIGVWFSATFHSWAQNLVPEEYRYSIVSFSYSIGSQLIGGASATVSLWLFKQTSLVTSGSWYWILLGTLTFYVLYRSSKEEEITVLGKNMG